MEEIMELDMPVLRIVMKHGAGSEEAQRKLLFQKANKQYQQALVLHDAGLRSAAQHATFYDIPIAQFKRELDHWNHAAIRANGSRIIHWQKSREYKVSISALTKLFTKTVFGVNTEVATFDATDEYRALAWLTARKLAREFITREHNVRLLYVTVDLATEYQKKIKRRSCTHDMWMLRITWD